MRSTRYLVRPIIKYRINLARTDNRFYAIREGSDQDFLHLGYRYPYYCAIDAEFMRPELRLGLGLGGEFSRITKILIIKPVQHYYGFSNT